MPEPTGLLDQQVHLQVSLQATLTDISVADDGVGAEPMAVQTDWLRTLRSRSLDEVALDGMLALEAVKRRHPAWFRNATGYPHEDFSSPDISGVEIDVSE